MPPLSSALSASCISSHCMSMPVRRMRTRARSIPAYIASIVSSSFRYPRKWAGYHSTGSVRQPNRHATCRSRAITATRVGSPSPPPTMRVISSMYAATARACTLCHPIPPCAWSSRCMPDPFPNPRVASTSRTAASTCAQSLSLSMTARP
eukprot:6904520-Prymnesium_polylepis.1